MAAIHWLGAGLSAGPGIRRLAQREQNLTLWNRTLAKAEATLQGMGSNAKAQTLDWDQLSHQVCAGDVVVSMLPATLHMQVAEMCLRNRSHFVSSSYVSPPMQQLSAAAETAGVTLLNEVGLDPGLDHLMAHALVEEYQRSPQFDKTNQHYFRSHCGGLSETPNDFRYKFSWSPIGVLGALRTKATWMEGGRIRSSDRPWTALSEYTLSLRGGKESFQAYPNRDSLPFRTAYGMGDDWNVQEFIRGTLRTKGWAEAWKDIFSLVDSVDRNNGRRQLEEKSEELWNLYRYRDGDRDRVVLVVELEAQQGSKTVWHQSLQLDELGNDRDSAMSRLVSLTVSLGVEAVLGGRIPAGVQAATNDMTLVNEWFDTLRSLGEKIDKVVLV